MSAADYGGWVMDCTIHAVCPDCEENVPEFRDTDQLEELLELIDAHDCNGPPS